MREHRSQSAASGHVLGNMDSKAAKCTLVAWLHALPPLQRPQQPWRPSSAPAPPRAPLGSARSQRCPPSSCGSASRSLRSLPASAHTCHEGVVQTNSQQVHGDPPRDLCLAAHTRVPKGIVVMSPQQFHGYTTTYLCLAAHRMVRLALSDLYLDVWVSSWALTLNNQS